MSLAGSTLLADFSYQETSTITGGMMMSMMKLAGAFYKQAREPHPIHRLREGRSHGDAGMPPTCSIIDLNRQTITTIDMQKKT